MLTERERYEAIGRLAEELERAGEARFLALSEAQQQLERVVALASDARELGVSLTEVSRLSSVSRPTLYERLDGR